MHHTESVNKRSRRGVKASRKTRQEIELRFTVGLAPSLASQVERYAETVGASKSKAIASLVRLGLESQKTRKQEFFKKLKDNLANEDPEQQDRLVDEFRALILGR